VSLKDARDAVRTSTRLAQLWFRHKKDPLECVHGYQDCTTCNSRVAGYWGEPELLGIEEKVLYPAIVILEQI